MAQKTLSVFGASLALLLVSGFVSPPAQAHCRKQDGFSGHCGNAAQKHHNDSRKKYLRDPDYNFHPDYGWGYYNVPSSYYVRARHKHHGTRHHHHSRH